MVEGRGLVGNWGGLGTWMNCGGRVGAGTWTGMGTPNWCTTGAGTMPPAPLIKFTRWVWDTRIRSGCFRGRAGCFRGFRGFFAFFGSGIV